MSLELVGITHRYNGLDRPTLEDITIDVPRGKIVSLVGPSGSGKTTLLSIAGLLLRPTSGLVKVNDQAATGTRGRQRTRGREVGWIFQTVNLLGNRSTLENVMIGAIATGSKVGTSRMQAASALEAVGLSHRANSTAKQLSGGEAQRTAIARALVSSASVVLADEPTANLDRSSADNVVRALLELRSAGVAVIVATHDPVVAARTDAQLELSDGRILGS